jgi:response regulator NasT
MNEETTLTLRVVVAARRGDRLQQVSKAVTSLGHEAIPRETELAGIGSVTAAELPDVALVVVGEDSDQALSSIGNIVHQAACPVIAILDVQNRAFVKEAAKRGLFAYITGGTDLQELQSSIDIVLRRFAEYHALEGAFGRRAVTERAKGILMERHGLEEKEAFEMLRRHARGSNQKIIDVADAIIRTHRLLPAEPNVGAGTDDTSSEAGRQPRT